MPKLFAPPARSTFETTELRRIADVDACTGRDGHPDLLSGLAIGTTVAILFLEELVAANLQVVAAGFFLLAIGLLMWALVMILRETQIAAKQLRIPRDYLELEREL